MSKTINIFSNEYDLSIKTKKKVIEGFESQGYTISKTFNPDAYLNIVIGGDGTFIKAVQDTKFSSIPFVGINTGHLGFYQEVSYKDIDSIIDKITNEEYSIQDLQILDCKVYTEYDYHEFLSLNEVVLKAKYTSIIHFNLYVNDILLESFAGDGVIFSTPSGSTAYNLSAGGAILYQTLEGFQITPLAPIRSSLHRSLDKSLVVPKDTTIKLITKKREETFSSLGIDGVQQEFEDINHIDIKLSDIRIKKLVFDENWYWRNVKEKFI